jgi:hypothetical protein
MPAASCWHLSDGDGRDSAIQAATIRLCLRNLSDGGASWRYATGPRPARPGGSEVFESTLGIRLRTADVERARTLLLKQGTHSASHTHRMDYSKRLYWLYEDSWTTPLVSSDVPYEGTHFPPRIDERQAAHGVG